MVPMGPMGPKGPMAPTSPHGAPWCHGVPQNVPERLFRYPEYHAFCLWLRPIRDAGPPVLASKSCRNFYKKEQFLTKTHIFLGKNIYMSLVQEKSHNFPKTKHKNYTFSQKDSFEKSLFLANIHRIRFLDPRFGVGFLWSEKVGKQKVFPS